MSTNTLESSRSEAPHEVPAAPSAWQRCRCTCLVSLDLPAQTRAATPICSAHFCTRSLQYCLNQLQSAGHGFYPSLRTVFGRTRHAVHTKQFRPPRTRRLRRQREAISGAPECEGLLSDGTERHAPPSTWTARSVSGKVCSA